METRGSRFHFNILDPASTPLIESSQNSTFRTQVLRLNFIQGSWEVVTLFFPSASALLWYESYHNMTNEGRPESTLCLQEPALHSSIVGSPSASPRHSRGRWMLSGWWLQEQFPLLPWSSRLQKVGINPELSLCIKFFYERKIVCVNTTPSGASSGGWIGPYVVTRKYAIPHTSTGETLASMGRSPACCIS